MIICPRMLIINADDLGEFQTATDNILSCHRRGLITSAGAMVFMADSERAAEAASTANLETGLHLNLDRPFTAREVPPRLRGLQAAVAGYLNSWKGAHVVYNPLLNRSFHDVFRFQYDAYGALYGKEPAFINGHHHRHLCMNMLAGRVIPPGLRVRRDFSPERGDLRSVKGWYRRLVDRYLARRHPCTDWFFSIEPTSDQPRFEGIIQRAATSVVELMVHPAKAGQIAFLTGAYYRGQIDRVPRGPFRTLPTRG